MMFTAINNAVPQKFRSDKGTIHSYLPLYGAWFSELKKQPINILEIGVGRGGSIVLWSKYFEHPETRIYGVDKKRRWQYIDDLKDTRVSLILGDVNNIKFEFPPLDIVIDDGSHRPCDQIAAFRLLYGLLRPGGYYIIEDIVNDEAISQLLKVHNFEVCDLRKASGRYDDVLLIARR